MHLPIISDFRLLKSRYLSITLLKSSSVQGQKEGHEQLSVLGQLDEWAIKDSNPVLETASTMFHWIWDNKLYPKVTVPCKRKRIF